MSKTSVTALKKTIHQKREQFVAIREEVEDLLDCLEVLEARARDEKKARLTPNIDASRGGKQVD